jgi:hypothetical protein
MKTPDMAFNAMASRFAQPSFGSVMPMLRCLSTGCGGIFWIQKTVLLQIMKRKLNKESTVQECDATMLNSNPWLVTKINFKFLQITNQWE